MSETPEDLRTHIDSLKFKEKIDLLNELYDKWLLKPDKDINIFDFINLSLKNFGLNIEGLQIGTFEREKNKALGQLVYLQEQFEIDENYIDEEDITEYKTKFTKIFKVILNAENAIGGSLFLQATMTHDDIGKDVKSKMHFFQYTPIEHANLKPYEALIIYAEEQLKRKQYKRRIVENVCYCYEKIYNKEKGFDTHAWKMKKPLKKFLHDICDKNYNFVMWQNLGANKNSTIDSVYRYLMEYTGPAFEDITKDRNVFSFNNGVYFTKIWDEDLDEWTDEWVPYEGEGSRKIGPGIVSAKLFNVDFEDCTNKYSDWFKIIKNNCPSFVSIMEYQQWPEEVMKWLCIFIGRMFYKIGELDDWQVIGYLLGLAGTGKSTFFDNVIGQLYEKEDVGVLSNNGQRTFGLSAIYDKFIFYGPEIKGNLSLEQAEFQSMISGESTVINVKHEKAFVVDFDPPGMLGGNELPNYTDNAGSITRRIIVFPLDFKVKKGDTKLGKKLKQEIAYIIQACNKGYLEAIYKYKSDGIWNILPKFFHDTKESMAENTNSLTHFLKSGLVKIKRGSYCREKDFIATFNDHCRESHFTTIKWTSQFYGGPFQDFGIKVKKNGNMRYPNEDGASSYGGNFIMNVDIVDITRASNNNEEGGDYGFQSEGED